MIESEHDDLLDLLAELRQRYPAWRFGQLVANVAGWADQEVWEVADDQLAEAARLHLESLVRCDEHVRA
jgi:hypothetical protein